MPFLTLNQFFSCHGLKWATVSLKKLFSTKLNDFPEIRRKNVEYFNLVHAHKPKFGLFFAIACFKLFSCPFALLFLASFTLATFYISYPFWLWQKAGYEF